MTRRGPGPALDRVGLGLCVLSAAAFGSLAIFGKQAYSAGFDAPEVLAVRFTLATPMLAAAAKLTGRRLKLNRPTATRVFAMGAVGYAVQATLFFSALARISASLTGLLLYLYPALVTIGAVALARHRATRLTVVGLAFALAGTALIVGLPSGHIDRLGVVLGLLAAVWYSGYILVGETALKDVDPVVVSVYVCLGAATSFVVVGGLLHKLDFDHVEASGWIPLAAMALLATVLAIAAFFAGMALIGSTWASIASSWEPVCTVILGVLVLDDRLTWPMAVGGGAVVLGAIVLPLVGGRDAEEVPPAP